MPQILIAAFDDYDQALQVRKELQSLGLSADRIQLSMASNPQLVEASGEVEVQTRTEKPLGERISDFFHGLLGEDHARDSGPYPEAIHRGSTVVSVSLDEESSMGAVIDCMERNGAVDIDERAARWGSQPLTASTEALTTGYPQATSSSAGIADAGDLRGEDLALGEGAIPGRTANARAGNLYGSQPGRVRIVTR